MNNKTILIDAINTFVIKWEWVYKPMYELLETYSNRKIILTNADDEQMKKFGLDDMPYKVFTFKHNPEKTEPEYYKRMLEHFDLDVEDVIYFEHSIEAVESAKSVWITTYYYDMDKKEIEALKQFLDDNT